MTDSNSPKRKTLGIKAASDTGTAARKTGNRPVRVSDLNRNRVRAVTEGIKRAQQSDGGKRDGRRAPVEAQAGGDVRKPRPPRPADGERQARPRRAEGEARPPRRFGDDDNRPRRYGDDRGEARPRRFEGNESRPPRRFGDDDNRPRRYGDDRGEARPRRFEGNESRPPRRFGDDDNRPRRYGDDENRPRRPAPAGERRREGSAPARRFSDAADRIRTAGTSGTSRPQAPAPRPQKPARDATPQATHDDGLVRLSKRMSELGLCSRREADEWIPRGWVLVDGKPVTELGSRIRPDAEIEILQEARSEQGERVTVLLHKPVGYVSGQAEDGYEPAAVLFTAENQWEGDPSRKRFAPWQRKSLAPAGRLDIDSTGLLVLTQDGRVARALIGEDSNVEKEYLVRVVWHGPQGAVERNVSEAFPADQLELLRHGLSLDGVLLKPAKVSWQNEEQLRFVLREGRKRQIRRMCEQVGLEVVGLKRVRMGRVVLGDLPPGKWRFLGQFEKF
ncbi:pseudouridine synthase [Cupriavidus oxalaticus]|uniref:Dual-specificity RNA pseudouridine synthase RluF n=1 Tax=Cupriavidus oxalaticus TaxID=96344 RepID=A0A375G1U2_9BURK|nr:pseudouridine synthase [Cupriavidus oxalaticus]SPC12722.1 16S rRNA uridine-516 pseudouridylate synthase [Cupriavidus oxalaticus]